MKNKKIHVIPTAKNHIPIFDEPVYHGKINPLPMDEAGHWDFSRQERSYNKEEVLAFGKFCLDKVADFLNGKSEEIDGQEYSMEELLEQFKKK